MQYKSLISILLFSAVGNAMSGMPTAIPTAIPTDLIPPSSIISVFETAIPPSALANPAALQSLIEQGTTASWYQALPADAKSWISHVGQEVATMTEMPSAGETSAEYGSTTGMAGSMTAMSSGGSGGSASGAGTSSSAGGASMPTGPVAAGVAGVAGIIGLAIAL